MKGAQGWSAGSDPPLARWEASHAPELCAALREGRPRDVGLPAIELAQVPECETRAVCGSDSIATVVSSGNYSKKGHLATRDLYTGQEPPCTRACDQP